MLVSPIMHIPLGIGSNDPAKLISSKGPYLIWEVIAHPFSAIDFEICVKSLKTKTLQLPSTFGFDPSGIELSFATLTSGAWLSNINSLAYSGDNRKLSSNINKDFNLSSLPKV